MMDLAYWKLTKEGLFILSQIKEKTNEIKEGLANGALLSQNNNDDLARAYSRKIGFLEGLKYLEEIFDDRREEREGDI